MQGAVGDAEREMKLWVGLTQPRPEVSMRQAGTTAAIGSFPFATRLLPLSPLRTVPYFGKKKKGKERLLLPSLPTRDGILSAAHSQHDLSGFEIAQLEFHHLH